MLRRVRPGQDAPDRASMRSGRKWRRSRARRLHDADEGGEGVQALGKKPADIKSGVAAKLPVTWSGIDPKADGLEVFWRSARTSGRRCSSCRRGPGRWTRRDSCFLTANGMGNVFRSHRRRNARRSSGREDPLLASWRTGCGGAARVGSLFTEAGLASFGEDQKALDERIRKVLKG